MGALSRSFSLVVSFLLCAAPGSALALAVGGTSWVSLGPTNFAGRIKGLEPHPTIAGTLYVGASHGGAWKTTDSGASWVPLTDDLSDLSVGALALAPSAPATLYLGTGEGSYPPDLVPGIGLLKSTDGGASWLLPASVVATGFYRISVHPTNAQELVIGTNEGGLRSTNGGASFTPVISKAAYGDVTELLRHPASPSVMYAATWIGPYSAAGASKVLKSTDAGATWVEKSAGLPTSVTYTFYERLGLAMSASNPLVLYAITTLYDSGTAELVSHVYKTTNGGDTWSDLPSVSSSADPHVRRFMTTQSWFCNTIAVSPASPDVVFAGSVDYIRSTDGGATFTRVAPPSAPHVDAHDTRYQGSTLWVATDAGVFSSADDGATSTDRNSGLVTQQYWSLALDPVHRNRLIGGAQDGGTPQRTDAGGTVFRMLLGSDGTATALNPLAPGVAYGTESVGKIFRTLDAGSIGPPRFESVTPRYSNDDAIPFLMILALDPTDPRVLYTATSRVWRSSDGGNGWLPLPTTVTNGVWSGVGIWSMAVSRSDAKVLLVAKGSQVYATTDGGTTWAIATTGLPGANIHNLEIDRTNSSLAYAALATTSGTSVYRTTNRGVTWSPRSTGLPNFAAHVIRVDPTDADVLYCGTDVGVYRSTDQGGSWAKFGTGLPSVSVHDIRILEDASMLRVATHGRGIWELQVPATGNTPPAATITVPAGPVTVAKGTRLGFVGKVSDADGGDSATGTWTFTDDFETQPTGSGASSRRHGFYRSGVFPITLASKDTHGALGAATVTVTVSEPADACATPTVIPGAGPFPYTLTASTEPGTSEGTDPQPSCVSGGSGKQGSVWFQLTPAVSATYEISTCGASFDTVLSVYTGAACGPYVSVGCNDDAPDGSICAGTTASLVSVAATAGVPLRIMVAGKTPADAGTTPLTVRLATTPAGAPRIASIHRPSGLPSGGDVVILTGASFVSGATASFGGISVQTSVVNPYLLSAVTPARAAGTVDVVVTNPDASTGTLGAGFTYSSAQQHGDVNGDDIVDIADVFIMINAIFAAGPLAPLEISDVNADGVFDIADVFYMINFIFANGPGPK